MIKKAIKKLVLAALILLPLSSSYASSDMKLYDRYNGESGALISKTEGLKYEVLYFFNYNCPSCLEFEEVISNWEQNIPKYTELKSIPTTVFDGWQWSSKMHFYAKKLSPEMTRKKLFNSETIQSFTVTSKSEMVTTLATEMGLPHSVIERTIDKVDVEPMMKLSNDLVEKFDVMGTPTLIVNVIGKSVYKVQPNNYFTYPQMMQLVNGIIAYHETK